MDSIKRVREVIRRNKLFTGSLAVGALLRLLTVLGYPGALWFAGDSYVYLGAALRPQPNLSKTTGYSLFLRMLLPLHSLTLVVVLQHLMGLADAVMIYVLLRRANVPKKWATIATLPVLLDGYFIESEHLLMTEAVFTFCLMLGLAITLWRPKTSWWKALIVGLLVGYAAIVRSDGAVVLPIFPVFLLLRGKSWKTLGGWVSALVMCVGIAVPVGGYMNWFHSRYGSYGMTEATGFYVWGRVSSFADCARIHPVGDEVKVCPMESYKHRSAPGNFIWHAPEVHDNLNSIGGPVSPAGNKILTSFDIHALEAQPLDYVKFVVKDTLLAFEPMRTDYPGPGTVYYYSFHAHYVTAKYNMLPPTAADKKKSSWIPGGTAYGDWLSYGHQKPGVVNKIFAYPILAYQRVIFTWGPLLGLIFVIGLGGVIAVRRRGWSARRAWEVHKLRLAWDIRGTSMLPWITAAALLVGPIALADFDYRYLIPVLPFACLAAGLSFAPRRVKAAPAADTDGKASESETVVPDSVS